MLVDKKFIYLSLPRCASTSFHYSCLINGIDIQTCNGEWEKSNADIDFKSVDKMKLMDYIYHGHESIVELQSKFGNDYPVISVRRQRHERFYSLYKHILFDFQRLGFIRFYDAFSKLSLDELFFFTKDDITNKKQRWNIICDYLIDKGLLEERVDISLTSKFRKSDEEYFKRDRKGYAVNMIDILLTPVSFWTNSDPNIIWFDFEELGKLEGWVSDKTEKPFQLYPVNSSKHMECEIVLNNNFRERYDKIYDYYDFPKNNKTLI